MNKFMAMLTGLGAGAGLMYFLDPIGGNRRRILVRDQAYSLMRRANYALDAAGEDVRNRTRGVLAEGLARVSAEEAPDYLIEERVRAEMGRATRRARAIEVSSRNGVVTLKGPALIGDVESIVEIVSGTRGVRDVKNRLQVFETAENIPELQVSDPVEAAGALSPAGQVASAVGGSVLALYGLARGGLLGKTLGVTGIGLAVRGVANRPLGSLIRRNGDGHGIRVNKTITIAASPEELYRFWMNVENFPKFMENVHEVRDLGAGRTHWRVAGPADMDVEWDAIITRDEPGRLISWESVPEQDVRNSGTVHFYPNPDGSTRLSVYMEYTPPAGIVGHAVASFLGQDPKSAMNEDLNRLKNLIEQGFVQGRSGLNARSSGPGMEGGNESGSGMEFDRPEEESGL